MNFDLGLLTSALMLFLLVSLSTGLFFGALLSSTIRQFSLFSPPVRANALWLLAALPSLLGFVAVCLAMLPSLSHAVGFSIDHCMEHGHHAHFCFLHSSLWKGSPMELALLGLLFLFVVYRLSAILAPLVRSQVALASLERMSEKRDSTQGCVVLNSQRVFAFTAGLFRPRIFVSSQVARNLREDEYRAVIEHEKAHRSRRDGLRSLSAKMLSEVYLPKARRMIMKELGLAIEQTCDEYAARMTGDRLTVAQAVVKLSRAAHLPKIQAASVHAFNASDCERRVTSLLNPPAPRQRLLIPITMSVAVLAIAGALMADFWHHSVESMIHIISG